MPTRPHKRFYPDLMTAVDRDKSRYVLFDTNYFLQSYIFLIEIGWPMEDLKKSLLYFVNYFYY